MTTKLTTDLEDFKSSDIEDADEWGPLSAGSVQRLVDPEDQPPEHPLVQSLSNGLHSKLHLTKTKQS